MGWTSRILSKLVPQWFLRLAEGFWIVPLLLALLGIGAGAGLEFLPDKLLGWRWERAFDWLQPEVARAVLSTVATGVMTAASIVFSLTFVTLSLTAQQLSPRILDFVLRDRTMQVMIGMAIATFLFCVVALIATGEEKGSQSGMAAAVSVPLAAATLLLVVVFAFRMTRIIRADEMVARLGDAFVAAIRRAHEAPAGCVGAADPATLPDFGSGIAVLARRAGYAGAIDHSGLLALASARDLVIELELRSNDFVLPGQPVARVLGLHPGDDVPADRIGQLLNLTDRRAPGFEADFAASSLSEAAIRALSPGINDPATARAALNRLFEGLAILAAGAAPPRALAGSDGVARLFRRVRGLGEFLGETVAPVAEAAKGDSQVCRRLETLAARLADVAVRADDRAEVERFRAAVAEGAPGAAVAAPGS